MQFNAIMARTSLNYFLSVSTGPVARRSFAWCALLLLMSGLAPAQTRSIYGRDNPFGVEDLPEGALKSQIQDLAPKAQAKAMGKLHTLNFSAQDAAKSLSVTQAGDVYYACSMGHEGCSGALTNHDATEAMQEREAAGDLVKVERSAPEVMAAPVPISSVPAYNSLPGAEYHIYLDFNGTIVENTAWNSTTKPSFDCLPYDLDGDPTTFSDEEQESIRRIWERMAEDFAPFAVNVTTDLAYDPDNIRPDRNRIAWALFTAWQDANGVSCPHDGRGGVAFINVFGQADFHLSQPAWCLDAEAPAAAEIGSHEVGHNLGLSHDGNSNLDLIVGLTSSSNAPGWSPIMGNGAGTSVSQWSKGEYYDSNNPQDDLTIIANHIPVRTDDHGGTFSLATPLAGPTVDQKGIVERTGDIDVFRFEAAAGELILEAIPYRDTSVGTIAGNLDIVLEVYDSGGRWYPTTPYCRLMRA